MEGWADRDRQRTKGTRQLEASSNQVNPEQGSTWKRLYQCNVLQSAVLNQCVKGPRFPAAKNRHKAFSRSVNSDDKHKQFSVTENTHTCTHMHTHAHTRAHTHTRTHARTHTHTHARTHTHTHTRTHAHAHTRFVPLT